MQSYRANRRSFLQSAAVLGCAGLWQSPRVVRAAANDTLNIGVIGVGGMGRGHVQELLGFSDVRIVALADVDEGHLGQARDLVKPQHREVETYADYRKLLDRADLQGVVIATPDHWHARIALHAMQADRDVYCQKPLTHNVAEGRALVHAAQKLRRVTQMGNQIHATENYHRVAEIVQSGVLGKIGLVQIWMADNQFPGGRGKSQPGQAPSGLDYDTWLGPAPLRDYTSLRSHFNWRYFWDYGGGHFLDFVCHLHDLVHWGMQVNAPLTAAATGRKLLVEDDTETPNTLLAIYEYPEFFVEWGITGTNGHGKEDRRAGVMFQGTRGTLHCHYDNFTILPEQKGEDIQLPEPILARSPGHLRQWLNHIRTREACDCDFEYGHRLTSVGHLGNISIRTGEKLHWDASEERVTNHLPANAWLTREYRKNYELPTV